MADHDDEEEEGTAKWTRKLINVILQDETLAERYVADLAGVTNAGTWQRMLWNPYNDSEYVRVVAMLANILPAGCVVTSVRATIEAGGWDNRGDADDDYYVSWRMGKRAISQDTDPAN